MKSNKFYLVAVALLCIFLIFIYIFKIHNLHERIAKGRSETSSSEKSNDFDSPDAEDATNTAAEIKWIAKNVQGFDQRPLVFTPSPFKLLGRGRNAKIVHNDSENQILPPDDKGIYGFSTSPNGNILLVYYGDADYEVRFSNSDVVIHLPSIPNIPNPVGFEWQWLSNDLLVGIAGRGYDKDTKPESKCCDQHTVAESIIGVYKISGKKYSTVTLPNTLKGKVFNLGTRSAAGIVELLGSGHEDDGKSLGRFSISPE